MQEGEPPVLCVAKNHELLLGKIETSLSLLLEKLEISTFSLFRLESKDESIKVAQVRDFIAPAELVSSRGAQIFYFPYLHKLTSAAQNACLKFFEEPGKGNIIIAAAPSLENILDTIVSRFQLHQIELGATGESHGFQMMIASAVQQQDRSLIEYFFREKYDNSVYISFLEDLARYCMRENYHHPKLSQIPDDISGIRNNNFQSRYVVDSYVLSIYNS